MRNWPLLVRLGAWVALGLMVAQILLVVGLFAERSRQTETGFRFPLPDQAAAIVELLDTAPNRATVLRAVNRDKLAVSLTDVPFAEFDAEPHRLPRVEDAVRRYLDALGERPAAVFFDVPEREEGEVRAVVGRTGLWSRYPMRLAIGLADGRTVLIEARGDLARRVYNWPLGLLSGVVGAIVGGIALWALRREMRPVRHLAAAAEAFGQGRPSDPVSDPVPEAGAPELRSLIANFNLMRQRIGELLENRNLILGAMSHDLRTYLTRLRLRVDAIGPEADREKAIADIERMSELVEDSLSLASLMSEGRGTERVELSGLLAQVAADLDPAGDLITLEADGPAVALGTSPGFQRLFANLIENALKFGSVCAVTLRAVSGRIIVAVADDGPGIPQSERAHVVRPFWRGDAARTLGGKAGTGLGLAIASDIVTRAGGTLRLEDNTPHGLRCVVEIPAVA